MKSLEALFEKFLWSSRLVVLTAVISSLLASLAMFYMATVDSLFMIAHLVDYANPAMEATTRTSLHAKTVTHIVEIVDGYLLATVLLIFALGLYELFISEIDIAGEAETSSNILLIKSLDDLKARLAKVILMILIVKFFEHTVSMEFSSPLDLLYMSGGIALIGVALFLSHAGEGKTHKERAREVR